MKISRKRLIKLAFKALDNFPDASPLDRSHMLYGACTMHAVAVGAWAISPDCGCLVGTMLLNKGLSPEVVERAARSDFDEVNAGTDGQTLMGLGVAFDDYLTEFLHEKYGQEPAPNVPVRVTG